MLSHIDSLKKQFESFLDANRYDEEPKNLYEPINYILGLGGKRLRPILCLLGCNMYGNLVDNSFRVAMAIEVFHNFTLISDDIMDDALIRRGNKSVFAKYGINAAILSSDAMIVQGYEWILSLEDQSNQLEILKRFNRYAMEVCIGQQLDMNFETQENVSIDEYIEMIKLKTAVLLGCSLSLGGMLYGATDTDIEHLQKYGENIGIAFQLKDDLLDTFGNASSFGKKIGGDILQNKKTYLYIKSLELLSKAESTELKNIFHGHILLDDVTKLERVTYLFRSCNVKEYTLQLIEAYSNLGLAHLEELSISKDKKQPLRQLTDYLLERTN